MKQVYATILAIVFVFSVFASDRKYYNQFTLPADSIKLVSIDSLSSSFTIEVRAALTRNDETTGKSKQKWGIVWDYKSPSNYCYAMLQCANSNYGDFTDQRYAVVNIGEICNGADSIYSSVHIERDINTDRRPNSILLEFSPENTRVFAGSKTYNFAGNIKSKPLANHNYGIYSNEDLIIHSLATETKQNQSHLLHTNWNVEKIDEYLMTNTDSIQGYWKYLDRNIDTTKARLGGNYKFAIIKEGDKYLILYISGAVTNSSHWESGMIKGELRPTIFKNHYDLVWYDSMLAPIKSEAYAEIISNAIINLNYPLYKSSFRLVKILSE